MSTLPTNITITITVSAPAGANVSVSQGGGRTASASGGSKPFTPRPDPEYPDWDPECPEHGVAWRLVPAGTSKNKFNEDGSPKRFNAFWACPERGCNEKPQREPEGGVDELGF